MEAPCIHGVRPATRCALCAPRAEVDFETRSELSLKEVGAWRYSEHASTEVLCLAYRLPESESRLWTPLAPFPQELVDFYQGGGALQAHNAQFERAIWRNVLTARLGVPMPMRWVDTMASCAYRALPLKLEEVGRVLDLSLQKDPRGKLALERLTKPRKPLLAGLRAWAEERGCPLAKPTKVELQSWVDACAPMPTLWSDDLEQMQVLHQYCLRDADSEHELSRTVGDLPISEYRTWVLDQTINQRGVRVDLDAVDAAISVVEQISTALDAELAEITGGAVTSGGQVERILKWCEEQEESLESLDREAVESKLLSGLMPGEPVERVLRIRQELSRASTKKLYALRKWACADGRVRGMLQYHAASTGRWAGRGPQPQNFPRGDERLLREHGIDGLVDLIRTRDVGLLRLVADPMEIVSTALRGMFVAGEGKRFMVADFSAIEGVVTAWIAGEQWKLDAFARIFAGEKYHGADDIYCATASKLLGRPVTKKDNPAERQTWGKVPELAFGYGGGVGAWRNFDKGDALTDEQIDEIKESWRAEHPETKRAWYGLEDAAVRAVDRPGREYDYRAIGFQAVEDSAGKWLTMTLPNDRRLWYYRPWIAVVKTPWDAEKRQVHFWGGDSRRGGAWTVCTTWGGTLMENAAQAISRDILAEAMIRAERAGYPVVLTVHDEVVSESDEAHGSDEEFLTIMKESLPWLPGCPIGAAGWSGRRYRKG